MRKDKDDILVVIPARGGSKGVSKKNLRLVGGIPLVCRAIQCSQTASLVSRTVVSTDDAEIATVAAEAGAEVVMRPGELATDFASSESVVRHCLMHYVATVDFQPAAVVMLQCTAPFTVPSDLDRAVRLWRDSALGSVVAVTRFEGFLWSQREGKWQPVNHEKSFRQRRQDRTPEYVECGSFYLMDTDCFLEEGSRFCGRTECLEISSAGRLEIDDEEDFQRANRIIEAEGDPLLEQLRKTLVS